MWPASFYILWQISQLDDWSFLLICRYSLHPLMRLVYTCTANWMLSQAGRLSWLKLLLFPPTPPNSPLTFSYAWIHHSFLFMAFGSLPCFLVIFLFPAFKSINLIYCATKHWIGKPFPESFKCHLYSMSGFGRQWGLGQGALVLFVDRES